MNLLRFDPAGAMVDSSSAPSSAVSPGGVSEQQVSQFHESLVLASERLRSPCPAESLLIDYDQRREASELGRVFRIANRLHDHLDAVAVIGDPNVLAGPAAWMQACCEPYHNELSRAGRGSKPRMYFADSGIDNDAVEGLLRRLDLGGYSGPRHEKISRSRNSQETVQPIDRYAILAVDNSGTSAALSQATATSLQLFAAQLAEMLGDSAARWLPKLIVPVANETGRLRELAAELGCEETFAIHQNEARAGGIYSAAAMLPAAFLGLDCIQFLVGATVMNQHFRSALPEQNLVIRYVATLRAVAHFCNRNERLVCVWAKSLRRSAEWYQQLLNRREMNAVSASTILCSGSEWASMLPANVFINQLIVETVRTDPILPDSMTATISDADVLLRKLGHPSTKLILPEINMHTLGQLFEFWNLSASLDQQMERPRLSP